MLIGELAEMAKVSRDTIRFYEKEGLIEAAERRDNNYKEFPETAADQIRFIKALQERGFTLNEIRDLLQISVAGDVTCGTIGERTRSKVAEIDAQIAALAETRSRLLNSFTCCKGNARNDRCAPIAEMRLR